MMIGMYLSGVAIYASQFPESMWPGRFDFIGHSHQLWHIFVVFAALIHYKSALELVNWSITIRHGQDSTCSLWSPNAASGAPISSFGYTLSEHGFFHLAMKVIGGFLP